MSEQRVLHRAWLFLLLAQGACVKNPAPGKDFSVVVIEAKAIRTNDPKQPVAEAMVFEKGRITFVGSRAEAQKRAPEGAHVEKLPNAVVVPGLADAHAHVSSLGRALSAISCDGAANEAECVARVKSAPDGARQGDWWIGRGWDQNDWDKKEFPTRATLDAAFPSTPVWLSRVDGHAAWVNGEALKRAGVDKNTKDPAGGRFIRDAKGEPTGVLIDNAMDVVGAKLPGPTHEQLQKRLKAALERCAAIGLTSIHDAGMDLETFTLLQKWDAVGLLPLRIYAMADGQGPDADAYLGRGTFEGKHLRMRAVKLLADGALGSRGAALHAPYSDEAASHGLLLLSEAELRAKAKQFSERGFQVAVHAIGDKANTLVIDVLSGLEKLRPGARHRVEHVQVLREEDVPRLAANGLIASFQPTHATSDMPWAEARLGKDRARLAYAWRSVLDTGAHVAFGSDFPVEAPEVLPGLYAARTRADAKGNPKGGWHPEQLVTAEEALAGFTSGAAYAEFAEERRGMLREGFDADFTVLDVDPVADPPEALLSAKVLLTVVDGLDVYRHESLR